LVLALRSFNQYRAPLRRASNNPGGIEEISRRAVSRCSTLAGLQNFFYHGVIMKLFLGFIMAALTVASCSSVRDSYRTETEITGTKVVVGKISRAVLENDSSFHWFALGYGRYTPAPEPLRLLQGKAADLHFVLFLGTWCSDSKAEVPKIFKLFDALSIPADRITLYGLDRMKKCDTMAVSDYAVTKVPTLIVYEGTKEIGRIVEQPREGIEQDISQMFQNAR
jgi:hypothetical protein